MPANSRWDLIRRLRVKSTNCRFIYLEAYVESAYFRSSAMCQHHYSQFPNERQFQRVKSVTKQQLGRVCGEINISIANISNQRNSSVQHRIPFCNMNDK